MYQQLANQGMRWIIIALLIGLNGCGRANLSRAVDPNNCGSEIHLSDKPLAVYQLRLLDIAFESAGVIPSYPHIKDRSKSQESVVSACLKLDQIQRALEYTEKIDNWRRGACYADAACYYAQHGCPNAANHCLECALQIAENGLPDKQQNDENPQQWRKDWILAKIAQAYLLLGKPMQAARLEKGLVDSEAGKAAKTKALLANEQTFDAQVQSLDKLIAEGNFDVTKNALEAYTRLFDRFYASEKYRKLVTEKIETSWKQIPIFIRIELLMKMAESALCHEDKGNALTIINQSQQFIDHYEWPLENRLSMTADLIKLRHRAGDQQKARNDADKLRMQFDTDGRQIVDIYRAQALRPLAEAYQILGDKETALMVYKRAIMEGAQNPNSRPRAEDLSATCCSMALYDVEPDADLWSEIHRIYKTLDNPW